MNESHNEKQNTPLLKAQTNFKATCEAKGLVNPTREESKVVLQSLIDAETDFAVKIAYTQLWSLTKDYHDNQWHDANIGRTNK